MVDFENWQSELENKLATAVKIATSKQIEEFEVYMIRSRSVNAEVMNGLVNAKNGGQIGIGARVVKNKKIGSASSSGLDDEAINFALDNALQVATSLDQKDEKWEGFHSSTDTGKEGKIDFDIINYDSEQVVNQIGEVIQETKAMDDRIFAVGGNFNSTYGVMGVANSEELLKSTKLTAIIGNLNVQARDGGKIKSDNVSVFRNSVPETLLGLTEPAVSKIQKLLKSRKFGQSKQLPVVFDNSSATQMVGRSLSNAINGEAVINHQSAFADKIGDSVAANDVTIYDDGQAFDIPRTLAIDAEGVARQTTTIIEDGVLLSYVFDTYHANIYDVNPTGNATRGGSQSYENNPNIGINPLRMETGSKSMDEIITEIDEGILLTGGFMGLHTTNVVSGDFSVVNQQAFEIIGGEIGDALEAVTVAGDHYEFFKKITQIGNEQEVKPGFFGPPSIIPSLELDGITISG